MEISDCEGCDSGSKFVDAQNISRDNEVASRSTSAVIGLLFCGVMISDPDHSIDVTPFFVLCSFL